ncbi:ATPase, partial [Burkholderia pseudomallei]
MKKSYENLLSSYIDALHPIIYINHFDSNVIDEILMNIGQGVKFIEYNNALGLIDFKSKSQMNECELEQFLLNVIDEGYEQQTFIVLKDIHNYLENPKVIALLKRIAEDNLYRENYNATIFIVSSKILIQRELEKYIKVLDIPLTF